MLSYVVEGFVRKKALITGAVTARLTCVFVFAHGKNRFLHDAASETSKISQF